MLRQAPTQAVITHIIIKVKAGQKNKKHTKHIKVDGLFISRINSSFTYQMIDGLSVTKREA